VNKKVKIDIPEVNLSGAFIIDKITIPLNYNGTMSITLSEVSNNLV
jgi:hypothetical protein